MDNNFSNLDLKNNLNYTSIENFENGGYYSLFSGYQNNVAAPVNLNRYPDSNKSIPNVYSPQTYRYDQMQNKPTQYTKIANSQTSSPTSSPVSSVSNSPVSSVSKSPVSLPPNTQPNLGMLMQVANKNINKIQKQIPKSATTDPQSLGELNILKNQINSIQSVADTEIKKVRSSLKRK